MGPSRSRQLVLLLAAAAICTAEPEPEAQGRWNNAPRRAAHRRSAFPNPEFDDWQPIGPGDPLSNAPTFQYAPPVLAQPAESRQGGSWPIRPRNPPVRVVTQSGNRRRDGPFSGSFFQFRLPGARKPQRRPRPGGGLSYISGPQFGAPQGERRQDFRGPPGPPEYTEEPSRLFAGQSNFEPQRDFVSQRDTFQQEFQGQPQFQGQPNIQEQEQERFERPEFQGQQNGPEQQQFQERPNFPQEQNSVELQRFEEPQQQFQPPVRVEQQRPPFFQEQPPPQQQRPQPQQPPRPQPKPQESPRPQPQQSQRPQPPPQKPPQSQPQARPQPQQPSQPRPQPRPQPQSQPQPRPQPERRPQQEKNEQEKEEERVQQRKELIRQKLQQQRREQLRKKLQEQRQKQQQEKQKTPDQTAEETKSETFVRVPPSRGQQKFVQPSIDKSPFVQIEPPKRPEIPPPEEASTTTQRVVVTTTRRQRRPPPNRRRRPPFRTTTTTTEKTTEAATNPTTTRTTTAKRRPSTSASTTTTTTTTTTERAQTTTAARTPPSTTATTTTRATTTTERRLPPTTTRRTTTERIVAERRPTLEDRRRVPLSSLLGKRPSRPDPVRFSSRPQRPRPGLFRRPSTTPKPQTTTKAPTTTTTRRMTTARPSPTTQRPVPTRPPVSSDEKRQKLVSRLAELRATRRPRPSLVNRLPLSRTPPSQVTTRRPPLIAVTAATAAAAPTIPPKTTTTNKPKPRRPTTKPVSIRPPQPFYTPTSVPFLVQHTQTVPVAKAPYVHQSGYSKIKMFGINVHDKTRKRKPAKKYKKPIYPIRIESRVKTTTAAPKTTTEARTTTARTSRPSVKVVTTPPPPPQPSTTTAPVEQAVDIQPEESQVSYGNSYEEAPVHHEQTDAHAEASEHPEGFTEDHAMMEKMYFEADGDPELMEASGDGGHFHHDFQEPAEHESFGIPEFQYEAVPPPAHAFRPQFAPPLPARRADHVTYREGDEPVPRPSAPGGDAERGQGRPGPPQRPPRPAGASSWMTGLLSSLFSRPKEPETPRPAPSPVSLLSGLFGGGGSSGGPPERRPQPAVDPYGFAPPPDNDPLATSASESVVVTDAEGEPLRPPAAFRNVPALAGLFAGLPAGDRPRFPAAARRSDSRPAPVRPVFFAKRHEAAERTDKAEVSHPFEYASTLHSLNGRLPEPEMVQEPTPPPQLVATRVPAE